MLMSLIESTTGAKDAKIHEKESCSAADGKAPGVLKSTWEREQHGSTRRADRSISAHMSESGRAR